MLAAGQLPDCVNLRILMKVRRLGQAVLVVGLTLAVVAAACAGEHWIKLPTVP